MSTQNVEKILAQLYCDSDFRRQFLQEPETILAAADLNEHERVALRHIDRVGLEMAARSYQHKRQHQRAQRLTLLTRVAQWLSKAVRLASLGR